MGADQFLLCKLNGDLLLGDEGIDCHGNGDDERPAQDYELGACAQIPEHCSCRGVSIFAWSQHDAPGAERHFSGAGVPFFPAGQHSSPQMAELRKPKFGAHRRYLNKSQVIPVVPPAHRPEPAECPGAACRSITSTLPPRGATGTFLTVYEPTRKDGETRDEYLQWFRSVNRPRWTMLTPDE